MEVTLDIKFTYSLNGLDEIVKGMDLMSKFKGSNNENFAYIQNSTGAEVIANPQWSGIQDGVSFTIKHRSFSTVKEATEMLTKMVESVLEMTRASMTDMGLPASGMNETQEISQVKCGICNRSHKSTIEDFEKHVKSHNPTTKPVDVQQILQSIPKPEPLSPDNDYRSVPFGKSIKNERAESEAQTFGIKSEFSKATSSGWDTLWDSDRHANKTNGSAWSSGQRSRTQDQGLFRKRGHTGSRSPSPKRKQGTRDLGSRRAYGTSSSQGMDESDNYLYSDISDEMIENPHPAEPAYIASGRLQILSELRDKRQLRDDECALLVDSFMFNLSETDQEFVRGLVAAEERAARQSHVALSRPYRLTMQLKCLCKFFITRSEQKQPNYIERYPFAGQMKDGTGRYTRTQAAHISSKGPKSGGETEAQTATTQQRPAENIGGLTQNEIENPVQDEPLFKSLRRRTVLEQERKENRLSDTRMRQLINKLKVVGDPSNHRLYASRRISKMTIPRFGRPSESQKLEAELFGLCDMIIEKNGGGGGERNDSPRQTETKSAPPKTQLQKPTSDESIMVAKRRRDTLTAARKSGELSSQQAREYIQQLMEPMSHNEKNAIMEAMMLFKRKGSPTPESELTEKLKVACDHYVNSAIKRDNVKSGMPSQSARSQAAAPAVKPLMEKSSVTSLMGKSSVTSLMGKSSVTSLMGKPASLMDTDAPWKSGNQGDDSSAAPPWLSSKQTAAAQDTPQRESYLGVDTASHHLVMHPHLAEPRYVSLGRKKVLMSMLEKATRDSDVQLLNSIINDYRSTIPQSEMNGVLTIIGEILRDRNVASLNILPMTGQQSVRVQAVFQYYLRKNQQERDRARPYPHERFLGKATHPSLDPSQAEKTDVLHRVMMNPHPAEPEYISHGRFKKLSTDRASGKLNENALESVLKEMRDSIPQMDKDAIARILNEEVRKRGMTFTAYTKTEQLDILLKQTCMYYAKKSAMERQSSGPYPYSHLLSQLNHPDFVKPAAAVLRNQGVVKTEEFSYHDLAEFFIMRPHSAEPELVSKGRYKKFQAQFATNSADTEKIAQIALEIKNSLSKTEKDAISQIFTRSLQTMSFRRGNMSSEMLQLRVICEYFIKLTDAERAKNGPYPHLYLLKKYITTNKDSQLRGTSRNGQYASRFAEFMKKLDIVKRFILLLAEQNKISFDFDVVTLPSSKYQATVSLGHSVFKETSTVSGQQATSLALYQALTRTEYAFHKLPDALRNHKPEKAATRVIVRSYDPVKSARFHLQVLLDQIGASARYTTNLEDFYYLATLKIGNETFLGTGLTEEAAKARADFFAVQQSSFPFKETPPGISVGSSGEKFRVIEAPSGLLAKRLQGSDSMMTNEFTVLVAEEMKQKHGLDEKESIMIDKKVTMLGEQIPTTEAWQQYWKELAVTKKLEYTLDWIRRKETRTTTPISQWLSDWNIDVILKKGVPAAASGNKIPWIPELEPNQQLAHAAPRERLQTMKAKIGDILAQRQNNMMRDQEAMTLLDNIGKRLPREMQMQVKQRLQKANNTLSDTKMSGGLGNWQLTMKLTIVTHFLMEQLQKQMEGFNGRDATRPPNPAAARKKPAFSTKTVPAASAGKTFARIEGLESVELKNAPLRIRYQKLRQRMNLLLRQRSGKNRTLTNDEVKKILREVNLALSPADRVKLLDVLRSAVAPPSDAPGKAVVFTKSWKLTKQLKATSEFLLDKLAADEEGQTAAEAPGSGKGLPPWEAAKRKKDAAKTQAKENIAKLDELPWISGLEGKVPRDITVKHRYLFLRKKLSNMMFRRKLRTATNGEMIRTLSCIKESLNPTEQQKLGELITKAIKTKSLGPKPALDIKVEIARKLLMQKFEAVLQGKSFDPDSADSTVPDRRVIVKQNSVGEGTVTVILQQDAEKTAARKPVAAAAGGVPPRAMTFRSVTKPGVFVTRRANVARPTMKTTPRLMDVNTSVTRPVKPTTTTTVPGLMGMIMESATNVNRPANVLRPNKTMAANRPGMPAAFQQPLPYLPAVEGIKAMEASVLERGILLKREMGNILEKRKNLSMSDIAARELLQKCRGKLSANELKAIDNKCAAAEGSHEPSESDIPWIDWKVTLELKTLLEHCIDRVEKSAKK